MEVIKEGKDEYYYFQQCLYCGSLLKYSMDDVYAANIEFTHKDIKHRSSHDTFICPICSYINRARYFREDDYKILLRNRWNLPIHLDPVDYLDKYRIYLI